MRILSIDWDYFMNCSIDYRTTKFPDGGNENIGIALSTLIWTSRYAQAELSDSPLTSVKLRSRELDAVRKMIDNNRDNYYYAVADSHVHLGSFLLDSALEDKIKKEGLEIIHIDHHHDMFGADEDKLNCGNWLKKVLEKYPDTLVNWIGNSDSGKPDSFPANFSYTDDIFPETCENIDLVYLCRSSVWSCPHLDKDFSAFNRYAHKRCAFGLFNQEVVNRWDSDMQKAIKQEVASLKKFTGTTQAHD